MDPRTSFRPAGEEIDGSFIYRGWPVLLEAKWTHAPVPASVLYQFRGKVDGKLAGTIGAFISMAGYAKGAVDALMAGKSVNLILFDGADVRKIAQQGCIEFERAMTYKIRAAAELGTPFTPLPPCPAIGFSEAIIVEGERDASIIQTLLEASSAYNPQTITIVVASGSLNLPPVALSQLVLLPEVRRIFIIADGEGMPSKVKQRINDAIEGANVSSNIDIFVYVIEPSLQAVLGAFARKISQQQAFGDDRNLVRLASKDTELRNLLRSLGLA